MKFFNKVLSIALVILCLVSSSSCSTTGNMQTPNLENTQTLTAEYYAAMKIIGTIKSSLLNPDSLIINSVSYVKPNTNEDFYSSLNDELKDTYEKNYNFRYLFKFDISGENSFGGITNKVYYAKFKESGEYELYDSEDFESMSVEIIYENQLLLDSENFLDLSKLNY